MTTTPDATMQARVEQDAARIHAAITVPDPSVCVYDGRLATTVRTGKKGNRFGLCADCGPEHQKSLITEQAIGELEQFRTTMQGLGPLSPRAEKFIDDLIMLIRVSQDPPRALDAMFRMLANEPAETSA